MLSTLTRANRALAVILGSPASRRISAAIDRTLTAMTVDLSLRNNGSHFESLEKRELMSATYYVSASGNDSSSGTSISSPWKSIGKVSSVHLNPGDKVLFNGGQTFNGAMHLYNDGGSASNPVEIGSYGSGRATLSSGGSTAIWELNSQGITVDNLVIRGTTGDQNSQDGVRIETSSRNSTKSGFTVTNCDISGYGQAGIEVVTDTNGEYLNSVSLTNNNIYGNVVAGIQTYSTSSAGSWGITNIAVNNNSTHDNQGNGSGNVTGSGISLGGVNGGIVSNNSSYNNGSKGNGAVGIWAYSANNVTLQYNQSYDNHAAKIDGDGFDFDADVSNSVMQYNLAYNNDGGGFMLDQWRNDSLSTNDTVRFNVSQNNARKFNYGEVESWGRMLNSAVYNNVIYTTPNSSHSNVAIRIHNSSIGGLYSNNVHFDNNVIETTGGIALVLIPSSESQGMRNVTFNGNVYYANGATPLLELGSGRYTSLSGWQSAGQEKLNGTATGMIANPMFRAAGTETATGGTFSLASMSAYDLQSSTPILNVGVNLSSALGIASPAINSSRTVPGIDQSLVGGSSAPAVSTSSSNSGSTSSSSGSSSSSGTTSGSSGSSSSAGNATGSGSSKSSGTAGKITGSIAAADIGSVSSKGSSKLSGGNATLTSGGATINGTSDAFRFAYTTLTGNGQIVTHINKFSNSSGATEAGLMIRSSTAANAAEVSLLAAPTENVVLKDRSTTGSSTSDTTKADSGDAYLKLVREGNTFSSYISKNGVNWTLLGTSTVAMGTTVDIGLAVQAPTNSAVDTTSFSSVSLAGLA